MNQVALLLKNEVEDSSIVSLICIGYINRGFYCLQMFSALVNLKELYRPIGIAVTIKN